MFADEIESTQRLCLKCAVDRWTSKEPTGKLPATEFKLTSAILEHRIREISDMTTMGAGGRDQL